MAFYRLASKDALNDFSLASNAPPPVNGHQAFLSSAYEFFGLLFSTRFARCLKLKLFLRDASTGIAGGFRNNKKTPAGQQSSGLGVFWYFYILLFILTFRRYPFSGSFGFPDFSFFEFRIIRHFWDSRILRLYRFCRFVRISQFSP